MPSRRLQSSGKTPAKPVLVLALTLGGLFASFPAGHARAEPAASLPHHFQFRYDIAPLLARHGCAAADCHGGATGRANFKLSLFATDARADHRAITEDLDGRRVDWSTHRKVFS